MIVLGAIDTGIHLECPYKDMVKTELENCTIAHFACHGFVDAMRPGQSSLILGRDTVEELTADETIDAVMHKKSSPAEALAEAQKVIQAKLDETLKSG